MSARERLDLLGVDCSSNSESIHPLYFCNRCYTAAPRQTSPDSTVIEPFQWKEHCENGCQVTTYLTHTPYILLIIVKYIGM